MRAVGFGALTPAKLLITDRGGMRERSKRAVLKTAVPGRVPGVRIPLPPPDFIWKFLLPRVPCLAPLRSGFACRLPSLRFSRPRRGSSSNPSPAVINENNERERLARHRILRHTCRCPASLSVPTGLPDAKLLWYRVFRVLQPGLAMWYCTLKFRAARRGVCPREGAAELSADRLCGSSGLSPAVFRQRFAPWGGLL